MVASMNIERTFDSYLIKEVMTRPDMWATVAEDDQEPEDYEPNMNDCWLEVRNELDQTVGIYRFHVLNGTTLQGHVQVLPEYRRDYAFESGKAALTWFRDNAPANFLKLIAEIPVIYQNVINFTQQYGFKNEGINRLSYKKNGEIVDQARLGITRQEIEDYLNG